MKPSARGAPPDRREAMTRGIGLVMGGCALVLWMLSLVSPAFAQSQQPIPTLQARVTDLTGTLTAVQQSMLEEKLKELEARKGSQLAVLLVPTTQPEDIAQYGIRVLDRWKVGRKGIDDGAILIVAKEDREMRIEVGRGLEGALTDALSSRIISETMAPLFRQGDFYGGINAGLDQMIRVVDGEQLPPPDRRWQGRPQPGGSGIGAVLPILFIVVFVGAPLLRALFGRAFGSILTGTVTGGLVWFAGQALLIAGIVGLVALFFSLMVGLGGARGWSSYPRSTGWGGGWGGGLGGFGGGWRGGGGFGGGGGGGFTGGGGTGAGGGASGRW
jgi:uncharacterized protein